MKAQKILTTALLCFLLLSDRAVLSQNRQRLAILPLSAGSHARHELSAAASAALENALIELFTSKKKFDVVERAQLEKIAYELQLNQSGMISDSSALRIGKMLSAELLLVGTLTQAEIIPNLVEGTTYYLGKVGATIKVVNSETAGVLGAITESASSSSNVLDFGAAAPSNDLVVKAARNLVNNFLYQKIWNLFPVEGYIIQLQPQKGNKAIGTIDLGSEMGVQEGDKFLIYRRGKPILHPVTKEKLPGKIVELGEAKVLEIDAATATVEVTATQSMGVGARVKSKEKQKSFWQNVMTN